MPLSSPEPLVDAAWLAARLDAPDLRILDATWVMPGDPRDPRAMHEQARIPGAIFFDIDEVSDAENPLPHMAAPAAKFAARMRALGVGDGNTVVVYDALGLFSAARVWWNFRHMGKEDVYVLDGGLPAWLAAGQPVEDGPPRARPPRHFTSRVRSDLLANLEDMRRLLAEGATQVIDARGAGRFEGREPEPRPGVKSGHMPGARNVPFGSLLEADGRMKGKEALAALFTAAGIDLAKPAVTTCGSGITAPIVALALARLGRKDARVYDGSWTEWGGREDTPIAVGPAQ
jgi:thiosulfate/3-mercaptopyruvate sulfurtransferase